MERSLQSITEEQKQQAFERARTGFNIENKILVRITEKYYKDAINILRNSFINYEPLCRCAGASFDLTVEKCWMSALQQNLSLMICNKDDEEAIGIFTLKIETQDDMYPMDAIKDPGMKRVYTFCEIAETSDNVYNRFNVSETVHLLSLAIAKNHRGLGIGTKLVEAVIRMNKEFKFNNIVCVKTEGSSNYSKSIFEKVGFTTLFDKPFDEYTEDGKQVFQNTGIHKSMTMYGMLLFPSLSS